jgi:hypothetical protein
MGGAGMNTAATHPDPFQALGEALQAVIEVNLPPGPDTPKLEEEVDGIVTRSRGPGYPRRALMARPTELSTGAARRA